MKNEYYNHDFFNVIDNEEKAYLLGFFIADGYMCYKTNRFGVNISEIDVNVVECFKKNICDNSIMYFHKTKGALNRKPQVNFRWSSEEMKKTFMTVYDIVPNKTYNVDFDFPFEQIPKELMRHFIRGFIDGDGSFESDSKIFNFTYVGTSYMFMKKLSEIIKSEIENTDFKEYTNNGKTIDYYVFRMQFLRTDKPLKVLKLYKYLYDNATIFLVRKKEKIESYLKYRGNLLL